MEFVEDSTAGSVYTEWLNHTQGYLCLEWKTKERPRSPTPTPVLFRQHVHGLAMFISVVKLTEGATELQNTKALKETAKHQVNAGHN